MIQNNKYRLGTLVLLTLLAFPLISSEDSISEALQCFPYPERTYSENINLQCYPEDIRYLSPEEIRLGQCLEKKGVGVSP